MPIFLRFAWPCRACKFCVLFCAWVAVYFSFFSRKGWDIPCVYLLSWLCVRGHVRPMTGIYMPALCICEHECIRVFMYTHIYNPCLIYFPNDNHWVFFGNVLLFFLMMIPVKIPSSVIVLWYAYVCICIHEHFCEWVCMHTYVYLWLVFIVRMRSIELLLPPAIFWFFSLLG